MVETESMLRGMAYVPGRASGELQRGTSSPGVIALVDLQEALEPISPPAAFIVVDAAPLSHAMIELVARGIPTVAIDRDQTTMLTSGANVSVDGASGLIVVNGGERQTPQNIPQAPRAGNPILLADGTAIYLMASVRNTDQARQALISGASGIGLVRSEFLAWDAPQPPDAARLIREFEEICSAAGQLTVSIRLIDIAQDKPPAWLPDAQDLLRPLGMQGSRLFKYQPIRGVLANQLKAMAELSERYPLEVLIPFVGGREELSHWIALVRRSLPGRVAIGAMAETPAAALDLSNWGDLVDFISLGSNDLIQFYFAADRDEPALSEILDPYAPGLYRLLRQIADTAAEYRQAIRLCGVIPRLPGLLPLLIGLGFSRFSVDPLWIPYLAQSLNSLTLTDARELAVRVCHCKDSRGVRELILPD